MYLTILCLVLQQYIITFHYSLIRPHRGILFYFILFLFFYSCEQTNLCYVRNILYSDVLLGCLSKCDVYIYLFIYLFYFILFYFIYFFIFYFILFFSIDYYTFFQHRSVAESCTVEVNIINSLILNTFMKLILINKGVVCVCIKSSRHFAHTHTHTHTWTH